MAQRSVIVLTAPAGIATGAYRPDRGVTVITADASPWVETRKKRCAVSVLTAPAGIAIGTDSPDRGVTVITADASPWVETRKEAVPSAS